MLDVESVVSVQVVYQDIRKLMALGFPGQSGELYEVIAKDAFLNSLGDPALRIRVLDQQPKPLMMLCLQW